MTGSFESNTIWEFSDDEVSIYLLVNIKYTAVVAYSRSPIRNTSHSTSLGLCKPSLGIPNTSQRRLQATIYNKMVLIQVYQCIRM